MLKQKTPPTVEQVRGCQWWWNYPTDGKPHVLQLDVCNDQIVYADENASAPFEPVDWSGEWAPCIPPDDAESSCRERIRAALKIAMNMARLQVPDGTVRLGIIAKESDGSGRVTASFESEEFLRDLETLVGNLGTH